MESPYKTDVFVYGTLKPGGFYHDDYCAVFRFEAEEGVTKGMLFDFPSLGYPGAIENDGHMIQGVLLRFLHAESEVLKKLDRLEGYYPDRPASENEYYRKQVTVLDKTGREISSEAWCYFMEPEKVRQMMGIAIESGLWPV